MPQPDLQPSTKALLEARELHLWRGEHHLLRGISFSLQAGQLLQLSGANGVGKTSLLRVVAGLLPAESGELLWNDQAAHRDAAGFKQQLVYLGHSNALKTDLTALENVRFSLALQRPVSNDQCLQALQRVAIAQCADLPARVLSAGQRRRVALARLALSSARIWILDEPVTNLDVAGIQLVESLLAEHLAKDGLILTAAHQPLLATHPGASELQLH